MKLINIFIVSLSGLMSVPSMAQNYCATYPNEASCCNPEFDNCVPREIYLRYGHEAGDFCVPGYPSTVSCRSEEHTSELQSPCNLVCRLLLEKKKKHPFNTCISYTLSTYTNRLFTSLLEC